MQAKNEEAVDIRVRRRLRELRMQRGLTLEDVASRSSIDVSTLSRLESGKRRLALDHLPRLATALSVSTDELLRAPEAEDPRVRSGSHTHNDVTYWPLTRHGPQAVYTRTRSGSTPVGVPRPLSYRCTRGRTGCTCYPAG